ncbi:acyl carrier protein [Candidatus Omnitrophota bacterium]
MGGTKVLDLEQEIKAIVAEVLETEPEALNPKAKFVEDLGMDSMMALEILAAIEKKFRVVIPEDSLPKFTTLDETIRLIKDIMSKKK